VPAQRRLVAHAARELRRLADTVQPGDIVTMHDGIDHSFNRNLKATISAIKPLVTAWQARNLELVRLDNLLGLDAYQN
jgi:peptidoglycan/xylan/chitin deacetylase (PgdA/CDA1 family)